MGEERTVVDILKQYIKKIMSEFPYGFLIVKYHLFSSSELIGKCPVLSIEMTAVGSVSGNAGSLTKRVNIEIMPFYRLIMNHICRSGSESMATQNSSLVYLT